MAKSKKLFLFLAAGLPSFLIAIPTNYVLVGVLKMAAPLAYALVLLLQVSLNFYICRHFVFDGGAQAPIWPQYTRFLSGIALFRLADWAVYSVLVEGLGFYFLAVQLANVLIFSLLKFGFTKNLMEQNR